MFDTEGQTNTPVETNQELQPTTAPQEDWLVIGERKFDKNAAATKITHADNHISKLEQELLTLRQQLELKQAQEEALKAMSTQTQSSPAPIVQNTTETNKDGGTELLSQVEQILQNRDREASLKSNLQAATDAARSMYGDAYQQKLEETGKSLGLSKADIVELASTKPQAFKQLFGLNTQQVQPKPFATSTVTVQSSPQDDPYKSTAKLVLNSASAKERTSAIAALLATATKR